MVIDKTILRSYRIHRLQRSVEYILLTSIFFFFLLAFREHYRVSLIVVTVILFFGMSLHLTSLRERRRMQGSGERMRIFADMIESILFLLLIVLLSLPSITEVLFDLTPEEHYGLIAAILCGIFMGGLIGEMWFQLRRFPLRDEADQMNYINNLKRTIILPYFASRKRIRRLPEEEEK